MNPTGENFVTQPTLTDNDACYANRFYHLFLFFANIICVWCDYTYVPCTAGFFYYQCIMYAAKLDTWYVGYCQQLLARPMSKRVERMFSRSKVSRSIDRSQEFFSRIKNENMILCTVHQRKEFQVICQKWLCFSNWMTNFYLTQNKVWPLIR